MARTQPRKVALGRLHDGSAVPAEGTRSHCLHCDQDLEWVGKWWDRGADTCCQSGPRKGRKHVAAPVEADEPEDEPVGVVRVADLPEDPPPGVSLYCPECDEPFSAVRGNYFLMDPGEAFTCGVRDVEDGERCGEPLQLVRRVVEYLPWKASG